MTAPQQQSLLSTYVLNLHFVFKDIFTEIKSPEKMLRYNQEITGVNTVHILY